MSQKFLSDVTLSTVTGGSMLKLDANGKIVAAVDGTDYISTSASSIWSTASGGIFYSDGVRIGTYQSDVAPDAKLHVFDYQTTTPKLLIEDGNTGDASMEFKISTQSFTMGIDNSDSDKFVIAASGGLGTSNVLEIATSGLSAFQNSVLVKGNLFINNQEQIQQGATEKIASFQNLGIERGYFEVTDTGKGYFYADGFKTGATTVGFLKSDGSVDTGSFFSGAYADLTGKPTLGTMAAASTNDYKTSDEVESYVAGELVYTNISGTPTLGTAAAADTTDFATAAQGALADTALQSLPSHNHDGRYYTKTESDNKYATNGNNLVPINATDSNYQLFTEEVVLATVNTYRGLAFPNGGKNFVFEVSIKGTNGANHQGIFWGLDTLASIYGNGEAGYKLTHQNADAFHIRDIATNTNQATSTDVKYAPNDGLYHRYKIISYVDPSNPDKGLFKVYVDGNLIFNAPQFVAPPQQPTYFGFINYTGDVTFSNWNVREITGEDELALLYGDGVFQPAGNYLTSLPAHHHDARYYTETEMDEFFDGTTAKTGYNKTNWDTAYSWGNHADENYLTSVPAEYLTQTEGDARYLQSLPSHNHDGRYMLIGGDGGSFPDIIDTVDADVVLGFNNYTSAPYANHSIVTTFVNQASAGRRAQFFHADSPAGGLWWRARQGDATGWHDWQKVWTSYNFDPNTFLTSSSLTGYATESYVDTAVSNLVASAPAALNTLNELAAALGDDANFSTTVTNNIGAIDTRINDEVIPYIASVETTANAALPKSGGTMTGDLNLHTLNQKLSFSNTAGQVSYISHHDSIGQLTIASDNVISLRETDSNVVRHTFTTNDGNYTATGVITASGGNSGQWNTAYGWGNHADAEYLTAVPATFSATQITLGNGVVLKESTDRADLLSISSSTSGWGGLQVTNSSNEALGSFMVNDSTIGLYDDQQGEWIMQYAENGGIQFFHNGNAKLTTNGSGANVVGRLYATNGILVDYVSGSHVPLIALNGATNYGLFHTEATSDEFTFDFNGTQMYKFRQDGVFTLNGNTITTGKITNWDTAYGWGNHAGLYLGVNAKAADSNLLDGLDSSVFMRKSANSVLDMNNFNIQEVNHISFNDSGFGEGLQWQNWLISDAPDDLSNAAGNLQIASTADPTIRVTVDGNGNFYPSRDRLHLLGLDTNRWQVVFCEILDSAGQHEKNLQNPEGEKSVGEYETGTVLVWKGGKNVPCTTAADHMRMGIAVKGIDSPLIQGAEPVLVTGSVNEGDYLVTSGKKEGHAEAISPAYMRQHGLYDCVLGKALESAEGESHLVKTWINI